MAVTPNNPSPDRKSEPAKGRRSASQRMRFAGSSPQGEKRGARPLIAAIGLHLVVGLILVRLVTLGHGLYDWLGLTSTSENPQERVTYVESKPVPVKPPVPKPAPEVVEPTVKPQPNAPATAVPSAPALPVAPPAASGGVRGGDSLTGGGLTGAGIDPNVRGIVPGNGDPRVWREPRAVPGIPRDRAEGIDSIIGSVIRAATDSLDSLQRVNATQRAGDWVKTDKNGNKWGWDGAGIRLGKVVIPNALLGLLPMNAQQAMSGNPTAMSNERRLAYARAEILRMSERTVGEADFKKSIRELRERREREHQQRPKPPEETKALPPKADNNE